jgi:putative flippase GtrA
MLCLWERDRMIDAEWYRRFYGWVEKASGKRADILLPLLAFLVIGGSASLLNLSIVFALGLILGAAANTLAHHAIISAIATEISIIYDFALNDRFTFRALIDPRRTWIQRCLRFHVPASIGFVLTVSLSSLFFVLISTVPYHGVLSQAMAILIVAVVNFTMHRLWTYRPVGQRGLSFYKRAQR